MAAVANLPCPSLSPSPSAFSGAEHRFLSALADRLAIGAASVVAVLDPGCVVLGGEVGQVGGEVLAARVGERLARMSRCRSRYARARWVAARYSAEPS